MLDDSPNEQNASVVCVERGRMQDHSGYQTQLDSKEDWKSRDHILFYKVLDSIPNRDVVRIMKMEESHCMWRLLAAPSSSNCKRWFLSTWRTLWYHTHACAFSTDSVELAEEVTGEKEAPNTTASTKRTREKEKSSGVEHFSDTSDREYRNSQARWNDQVE